MRCFLSIIAILSLLSVDSVRFALASVSMEAADLAAAGLGGASYQFAASTKRTKVNMTKTQKSELRRRAYEWCRKQIVHGDVLRVEILSDGSVRCWYKN
jgi:hypothetical protein